MIETRTNAFGWRMKLLLLLLGFSLGPVVILALVSDQHLEERFATTSLEHMAALATAKAQAIDQFTEDRYRDVERIAGIVAPRVQEMLRAEEKSKTAIVQPEEGLPALADAEALPTTTPAEDSEQMGPPAPEPPKAAEPPKGSPLDEARAALTQTIGLILWDQQRFEELLVMDAEGRVLASTFSGHEQKSAKDLDYFRNGLRATYLQPVFVSPITERLTTVVSTPIRDENHRAIGVLAARLNLKRFFALVNDHTGLGRSGETIVAQKIGDKIVLMAPTRHDPEAALKREVAVGSRDAEVVQAAAQGQRGRGRVHDYRGHCVLGAWQPLASTSWGLATKIDCEEALEPVAVARQRLLLAVLAILALSLIGSVVTARRLLRPLEQLKEATDHISRGNFDVQLDIQSNDEIGELADSFERMVAAIKFFREREDERVEEETTAPVRRARESVEA